MPFPLRRRQPASTRFEPVEEELLQLLFGCHTRIRAFSRQAEEIGRRRDLSVREVVDVSTRCARYFEEGLPLHLEDEEQSLVSRLLHKDSTLDAVLATMQTQHEEHKSAVAALIEALHVTASSPSDELARRALKSIAQAQVLAFDEHLALEERTLFPAIERHLGVVAQRSVVAELRARRQRALG